MNSPEIAPAPPKAEPQPRSQAGTDNRRGNRYVSRPRGQHHNRIQGSTSPFAINSTPSSLTHDDIAGHPEPRQPRSQTASSSHQPHTRRQGSDQPSSSASPRRTRPQGHRQPQSAASNKRTSTNRKGSTSRHLIQWIGVRLCGYGGSILISAGLAMLTVPLFGLESSWLIEGLVVIGLIRYVSHLVTKSSSILSVQMRHHQLKKLLIEQAQFASVFLGACYVMTWPIPRSVAAVFLLADSAAQVALMLVSYPMGKLLSTLKHNRQDSSHKTALIVGTGPKGTWVANTLENSPDLDTRVVGFLDYSRTGLWRYQDIPLMGHPDQLESLIIAEHIDAIFIALEPGDIARSDRLFRTAERMGVVVYVLPDVYEPKIARKSSAQLDGVPAIVYRTSSHSAASVMIKGLLDKCAAIIGLVLSSPIWLAAVIAIKIDSRGPIFFKQVRSGLNGRRFNLYKFRTMCSDAEFQKRQLRDRNEMSGPVFKIKNDPRITGVGRFLRKYSIDELPQLVNILKGEMSLVGPRPPIPDEVANYEPWQRRRLSVKPGLTCLWQVNGRNAIDFDDWMKLDLEYIDNWSLLMDARIVARTVPTVLKGSGI